MRTFRIFGVAAMLAAASAAHAQSNADHSTHGGGHTAAQSDASSAYMEAMKRMDEGMRAMTMSGRPGVDFALMMIPHHQSAIDMAEAYLESGEGDEELEKLSRAIIDAQEAEIAFLKAWLAKNGH